MEILKEKFRLTDEQWAILDEIRLKLREFAQAGGIIAYDYDESMICAMNANNIPCKFSEIDYISETDSLGWDSVCQYTQHTPFQIEEIGGYYTIVADLSMYKDNNMF